MSTKNSALASLTAQYTDSENEDDHNDSDDENSQTTDDGSQELQVQPKRQKSPTPPITSSSATSKPNDTTKTNKQTSNKALRLVSYNDDMAVSDEENVSPNRESINMDISEDGNSDGGEDGSNSGNSHHHHHHHHHHHLHQLDGNMENTNNGSSGIGNGTTPNTSSSGLIENSKDKAMKKDKFDEYGFHLPPESTKKCPQELQDKIALMHEKMKMGMDMNRLIQDRKEFRNPSIYEKLIQFCDIDEFGTNYPPEIYDPLQWGKESFYEELDQIQKVEMDKREKERKENVKRELVLAAAKKAEEEAKKRKSKWDQPAPGAVITTAANTVQTAQIIKPGPAGLMQQPTITTNATGTKGTLISAFGSLAKKPKV